MISAVILPLYQFKIQNSLRQGFANKIQNWESMILQGFASLLMVLSFRQLVLALISNWDFTTKIKTNNS